MAQNGPHSMGSASTFDYLNLSQQANSHEWSHWPTLY